jgi:hypothetical protein
VSSDRNVSDDLQVLANVLDDTPVTTGTRRRLLGTAAAGFASAGALGVVEPALAQRSRRESPRRILSSLATAESFGVTFLTEAVRRAPGTPSADLVDTLRAANTAEYDHVVALRRLGGRQFTLRFWIPEAAFGGGAASACSNRSRRPTRPS